MCIRLKSASEDNWTSSEEVTDLVTREMVLLAIQPHEQARSLQYRRSVIEFTGTTRLSHPNQPISEQTSVHDIVPQIQIFCAPEYEAQITVSGNKTITTMGWYRRSEVWVHTIIPITIVAMMMYATVAYTLWIFKEQGHESFTGFDPSNPIHVSVMMVSSARCHNGNKDDLDDGLIGFECGGISRNENLRVQLMNEFRPVSKESKVVNLNSSD